MDDVTDRSAELMDRIAGTDDPTQPMSSLAGIPYERQPLGEHTSKLVAAAGVWYGLRDRIDAVRP